VPEERGTYYITTPIYYASGKLHIGHAYSTVAADALARFKRMQGLKVRFLTGTDEHGQKIQKRARQAGVAPQQFVDRIVQDILHLWDVLHISYDDFIRTTEERHVKVVQEVVSKLWEQGDIYKSTYTGWYCVECESFWLPRQLQEGLCPDCGRELEKVTEESYFFRMSRYAEPLLQHIRTHPEFIQPESRRNEVISFIEQGLEDLCISRTTFDWGVPIPWDRSHVVYVWLDALSNYISAIGYTRDPDLFAAYWPADVHLVGKEIVRFHAIIWPAVLMALGLPLPRQVFGHGWLVLEGGKMSKSKGNVVDPLVLVDRYGVDAVRHFLLREIPFGSDGTYSEEALIARTNADLANDLGNLVHRTLSMVERYLEGRIPVPGHLHRIDQELRETLAAAAAQVQRCMDELRISDALASIWEVVRAGNRYLDRTAPWSLFRHGDVERGGTVLYNVCELIRITAVMLTPYLVDTPGKIWRRLGLEEDPGSITWAEVGEWGKLPPGLRVRSGEVLFPRIDERRAQSDGRPTSGRLPGGVGE